MVKLDMRLPMALAHGVPDSDTPGWIGLLVMDVTDTRMRVYRCVGIDGAAYTWEPFAAEGSGTGTGGGIDVETDPTVPAWAKEPKKPTYTADEIGALPSSTKIPSKTSDLTNDSGFVADSQVYAKGETYSQTEVDSLIDALERRLEAVADSDDVTLDQLSEIVAYIKSNKSLIDSITTSKINVSDIVDNLTTGDSKKPLSAAQGKALKALYDAIPAWAKESSKPSYSKSEVGLGNVENVKQYSASNPPPYPVKSVNGKTGAVTLSAADVGAATAEQAERLSEEIADYGTLTLGVHADGKVYIFKNGVPIGGGVEMGAEGDVVGIVDSNNNIIVQGNLPDGSYTVKYEMEDGRTVDIGNLVLDSNVYYSVTNNLTNCKNSNSDTHAIGGQAYTATVTANSGYELKSVAVTMGGSAVSVSGGTISIANVTGNIVITAVAEEIKAKYTNLADPTSADWWADSRIGSDGTRRNDAPGDIVTNRLTVKQGDVVRVKNLNCTTRNMGSYRADTGSVMSSAKITACTEVSDATVTATSAQFTVSGKDCGYIRIGGTPTGNVSDIIVTINEPID